MAKITKISPEQISRFAEWTQKWIEIGLSTEPADFDKATQAALRAYQLANLKRPMVILRMSSPFGATMGGALAWMMLREIFGKKVQSQVWSQVGSQVWSQVGSQVWSQVESQVRSQVGSQVRSQVESQVRSQVGSQVRSQVWSQVWSQVRSQVWSQVWSQVESQVWSQVGSQVRSQVWSQVRSQVESQVWSQVGSQVWSQVGSQVRSQVGSQVEAYRNSYHGAFWASWGAYISFFRDVMNWDDPVLDRFEIDEALVRSCGWTWWHENVLAISDRPLTISRDAQGRLHHAHGMAITYRDGWGFHAWHGLPVSAELLERKEFSPDAIDAQPNAELRRVMLEREYGGQTGFELYLKVRRARTIAQDELHGQPRRLIEVDVSGTPLRIIEVHNGSLEPDGSRRRFHLGAMRGDTPHDVVAASYGIAPQHYREAVRS